MQTIAILRHMHFGFSYMGLIFLIMLMVPNLLWTKNKPINYDQYVVNEKKSLVMLERIGEVAVSCLALIFPDYNVQGTSVWELWLMAACILMLLYEVYWIRYFKSARTMRDFYSSLLGVPVAGATLPVAAFFLLGIYGRNLLLIVATIILGIGHIGIHLEHKKELE